MRPVAIAARVAGILAAAAVPVLLFAPWYERRLELGQVLPGQQALEDPVSSGWESLSGLDAALTVLAALVVALLVASFIWPTRPITVLAALAAAGLLGVLVYRTASLPDFGGAPSELAEEVLGADYSVGRKWGLYAALAAGLVALLGSLYTALTGSIPAFKRCPDCATRVPEAARICRQCRYRFSDGARSQPG